VEGASVLPTEEERQRYHIEQTSWFDDASEYKAAVSRAQVYFAPRRFEGIGQAVLEAMALGLCVVSPDLPTMNEYIVHGETGLLFDADNPEPLDFSRALELGRNARIAAVRGRANWEASLPQLRAFLVAPPQRGPRRRPWVAFKGRLAVPLRAVYRALKAFVGKPVPEEWR
jgi:glycosyltransferase involved in cell wall biosynthesis